MVLYLFLLNAWFNNVFSPVIIFLNFQPLAIKRATVVVFRTGPEDARGHSPQMST